MRRRVGTLGAEVDVGAEARRRPGGGGAGGGGGGGGGADGRRAGTVHVAVASPWGTVSRELHLDGDRTQVRDGATTAVLALAVALLDAAGS